MAKLIILDEALMGIEVDALLVAGRAHFSALLDTIADTLETDRFTHILKEEFLDEDASRVLVTPYAAAGDVDIAEDLGWNLSDAFGISAQHPYMGVAAVDVMSALPEGKDVIDEGFRDFIKALTCQVDLYHRGSVRNDEAFVVCAVAERNSDLVERSYHALSGFANIDFKSRSRLGLDVAATRDEMLEAFPLRYNVKKFEDIIYVGPYDATARRLEECNATVVPVSPLMRHFKPALHAVLDALYDDEYIYADTLQPGLRL